MKFLAVYDNLVTDDVISEEINARTFNEAEEIAQKHSRRTGLSADNYTLYLVVGSEKIDVCAIYEAMEE